MCNASAGVAAGQSILAIQAQNSAYQDAADFYLENAERVKRSVIGRYAKEGIKFTQESLARAQKRLEIDSAQDKAMATAINNNSASGLLAGQVLQDTELEIEKEGLEAMGRLDQEQINRVMAFGLTMQDIELWGEYSIADRWPGEAPDAGAQALGFGLSTLGGYLAGES